MSFLKNSRPIYTLYQMTWRIFFYKYYSIEINYNKRDINVITQDNLGHTRKPTLPSINHKPPGNFVTVCYQEIDLGFTIKKN